MNENGKKLYDRIGSTLVRWADATRFQSKTGDGHLIGPFNPILFSPRIGWCFLDLQDSEQRDTTLSDRVRQVVILAVGAVWQAPCELYAHSAAARHGGLSEKATRTLVVGRLADGLSRAETTAFDTHGSFQQSTVSMLRLTMRQNTSLVRRAWSISPSSLAFTTSSVPC